MAGFDFYERRGNMDRDNMFFGGTAVTNGTITATYVANSFIGATVKNVRLENNIIKGYIYKPNSGTYLINISRFREIDPLDFVIIDNKGFFDLNASNGFEFFDTNIDFVWMPYVRNYLGRNSLNKCKWRKRAYFPNLLNLGRYNFSKTLISNAEPCRIYAPITNIHDDSFDTGTGTTGYGNVFLYLDYVKWNGYTHATLIAFVNKGGTIVLIQDYTKPTTPTNLIVSNITSTSIKVDFNPSTFTNNFGWYEIFCKEDENPVSRYFHHKEIATNSATISGLKPNTNYMVSARAADEYMNLSEFSNERGIKTLTV